MKVCFLTEAGSKIGLGHLTRSISISQGFEAKGCSTKFVVHADTDLDAILRGHSYRILDWLKDKKTLWQELDQAAIIVVDSYLATKAFYKELADRAALAVYVDDYGRLRYPKGIVLNGSMGGAVIRYPKTPGTDYLLGPKYMPLRREFTKRAPKKISRQIDHILIMCGGYDPLGLTPGVLRLVTEMYPQTKCSVVVNRKTMNDDLSRIAYGQRTTVYADVPASKVRTLMYGADLAVSTGGQTLYELACVGLPSVVVSAVDNQKFNIRGLSQVGSIMFAGHAGDKNVFKKLRQCLKESADLNWRKSASSKGRELVDGKGALRIAAEVLNKESLCHSR